ncbi:MAG: hypothetical protein KF718_01850 [Polyangiaceae bacterium]|nr:hypothetical protein [Polyangiaceae bacterium]
MRVRARVAVVLGLMLALVGAQWLLGSWLADRDPVAAAFLGDYVTLALAPALLVSRLATVLLVPGWVVYLLVTTALLERGSSPE